MMAAYDIAKMIERLRELEKERAQLLTEPLSPGGAWIHEYTKKRFYPDGFCTEYTYAKWQAAVPIFERKPKQFRKRIEEQKLGISQGKVKHQHIGRVGSSTGLPMDVSVAQAYEQWERRKRLEKIEDALAAMTSQLDKVLPISDTCEFSSAP
jgi:hypothetical protein